MDCTDAERDPEAHWRERQFDDAQALAHVGSWEHALSDDRAAWSDELCRIFGQPLGFSPTLEEFAALIHPEDRERALNDLRHATTGDLCDSRFRIVRPGGEIRHVQGRAGGRADDDGGVAYVLGTMQDVTDQHRAETARREAQDLFENAFGPVFHDEEILAEEFCRYVGQPVVRRYSGGADIQAACGTLAGG